MSLRRLPVCFHSGAQSSRSVTFMADAVVRQRDKPQLSNLGVMRRIEAAQATLMSLPGMEAIASASADTRS